MAFDDIPNLDDIGPGGDTNQFPQFFSAVKRAYVPSSKKEAQSQPLDQLGVVHGSVTGVTGVVIPPGLWKNNDPAPGLGLGAGFDKAADLSAKPPTDFKDSTVGAPSVPTSPGDGVFPNPKSEPSEPTPKVVKTSPVGTPVGGKILAGPYDTSASRADPPPAQDSIDTNPTQFPPARQGGVADGSILSRLFGGGIGNFFDSNRMTMLALAGGLAGSQNFGQGLGRGFTAAANTIPAQNALNNQNATMQFLMSPKGGSMDPAMARAVSANPALVQDALGQATGIAPPKTLTWNDGLGGQHVAEFIPGKGWRPLQMGGVPGTPGTTGYGLAGANGSPTGNYSNPNAPAEETTPEQRLQQVAQEYGPEVADTIKAMYEGRSGLPARMPGLLKLANSVYKDYNQATYDTQKRTMSDFTPQGVSGKNITAIETALGHIDRAASRIDSLANYTNIPMVNAPINTVRGQFSPEYQHALAQFTADTLGSSGELAKAFRSAGMSESDIQGWLRQFDPNNPVGMKASLEEGAHMLDSRLDAIAGSWNRGMPPGAPQKEARDFLSDKGKALHDKIVSGGRAPVAAQPAAAPQTQAPQVPPPQQRQVGQVYPTPKGPMLWLQDGWHPPPQQQATPSSGVLR